MKNAAVSPGEWTKYLVTPGKRDLVKKKSRGKGFQTGLL